MNEITLHGNLGKNLRINHTRDQVPIVGFSIAVNERYFHRSRGEWVSKPTVWHDVVVYGQIGNLANNTYDTLHAAGKGALVTVTGRFADDSYTKEFRDEDIRITKLKFEATDVAVSLLHATATVTRNERRTEQDTPAESAA